MSSVNDWLNDAEKHYEALQLNPAEHHGDLADIAVKIALVDQLMHLTVAVENLESAVTGRT